MVIYLLEVQPVQSNQSTKPLGASVFTLCYLKNKKKPPVMSEILKFSPASICTSIINSMCNPWKQHIKIHACCVLFMSTSFRSFSNHLFPHLDISCDQRRQL
ncbi:hypothetical protein ILYODFUR_038198 [Ilyodon furcidens]|uniref:Uncharacterized protein n=1 Tax=Ilyodon furcidens TaxID=33524 RepID=A0ABV0TET4_9TELE